MNNPNNHLAGTCCLKSIWEVPFNHLLVHDQLRMHNPALCFPITLLPNKEIWIQGCWSSAWLKFNTPTNLAGVSQCISWISCCCTSSTKAFLYPTLSCPSSSHTLCHFLCTHGFPLRNNKVWVPHAWGILTPQTALQSNFTIPLDKENALYKNNFNYPPSLMLSDTKMLLAIKKYHTGTSSLGDPTPMLAILLLIFLRA